MKNLFKSVLLTILLVSASSAYGSATGAHVVERIQITDGGVAYLRPAGLGGWGGDDCPNAPYAYIGQNAAGYENILSLAITSKLNGSPVLFLGTCDPTGNYLLITYIHLL